MLVYQTSPGVSYKIKKWGCAFLSMMYHVERLKSKNYTVQDLNQIAQELEQAKAVDHELTMSWDKVLEFFNLPYKCFTEKPQYELQPEEFEIQHWYNPNTNITHFVAGDGGMKPVWDPYPNSRTVREGFMVSRRVFRKVADHDGIA